MRTTLSLRSSLVALLIGVSSVASAHPVRWRAFAPQAQPASCSSISYGGGPMLQKPKVVVVQWGGASAYASKVPGFYADVVQSAYMDWLREYSMGSYSLERGAFLGVFVDPSPPAGTTVDEQQTLQPELERLIAAGTVPKPDADTLYMMHFGPGITVTQGGGATSCNQFCGFHGNVQSGSDMLRYAVIPDFNASCAKGCGVGGSTDPFTAFAVTASHELTEAITDPDGSGWYDNSCGEIGDMCDQAPVVGMAGGMPVQLIFSKKQAGCVDHDSTVKVGDFSLALDMPTAAAPGGTATVNLTAMPVGTTVASLALDLSGLPGSITAALAPASIMSNGMSAITFTVGSSVALGSYKFTVTGASTPDNVIHAASGMLSVAAAAPPDMGMTGGGGGGGGGGSGGGGSGGGGSGGGGVGSGGNGSNGSGSSHGCAYGGTEADGGVALFVLLLGLAFVRRTRRFS